MHYIGLLDCNNFFVSCERIFRPDLQRKPVAVLSGNDGCIVARSQEVRQLGVPMGVPYFKVKRELEAAGCVVFSANFALYRDVSQRVMQVLGEQVDQLEQYSVDEAFFSVPVKTRDETHAFLYELKNKVEQWVGIPVSVGAAHTKTIAKYAAEREKRRERVCVLVGPEWHAIVDTIPMREVWGVGGKTSIKLQAQDLHTVADFLSAGRSQVAQLLGIDGARKYDELSEQSIYKLGDTRAAAQSIMSTRAFAKTTTKKVTVADALTHHVNKVAVELRAKGMKTQVVRILALTDRHSDWHLQGGALEVRLPTPSDDTRVLLKAALMLWDDLYKSTIPYKKAGVVLQRLVPREVVQPELFATEATLADDETLMQTIDEVNNTLGTDAITVGRFLAQPTWQSKRQFVSPGYTTRWRDIPTCVAK